MESFKDRSVGGNKSNNFNSYEEAIKKKTGSIEILAFILPFSIPFPPIFFSFLFQEHGLFLLMTLWNLRALKLLGQKVQQCSTKEPSRMYIVCTINTTGNTQSISAGWTELKINPHSSD